MKRAISKDATRCNGGTTTKNQRTHLEDDHHFRVWNTSIKRQVAWTHFHSAKDVGPSQYLMTPLVQLTKPKSTSKLKLTLKPLPANSTSKLVPPETQSDAEEHQCIQLTAKGGTRRVRRKVQTVLFTVSQESQCCTGYPQIQVQIESK